MWASRWRSARRNISARDETTTVVDLTPPNSKTISSLCQDQQVKVDSNIYHLDRLRSSLKSNYFEKLFTSGDFKQKNDKILEIQPKNSELFPIIVDLIHEKKLLGVLNKENYVSLLEAMDYFEMKIDLKIVSSFIDDNLTTYSPQDAKLFELYSFIRKNTKFEYLLPSVFKCMSGHLTTVRNHEIFPSLLLGHLIGIIKNVQNPDDEKRYEIVQMCVEWLCNDMENRFPHIVILINSVKPEFHSEEKSDQSEGKLSKRLPKTDIDEQAKRKTMVNCVFSLLAYGGKLNPTILSKKELSYDSFDGYESDYPCGYPSSDEPTDEYEEYEQNDFPKRYVHNSDEHTKLKKFRKNGDFCDITVQIGEKTCTLHRAVLESKCGYFASIFQAEYAEALAHSEEIPTCPGKDKRYLIGDFDQSTFTAVINYIYFDNKIPFNFDVILRIFNIAYILKIQKLSTEVENWLKTNLKEASSQDVIEILNFTHGKTKYNDLHSTYLCKHMTDKWPEIHDVSKFHSISWPVLKITLMSPNLRFDDPNIILDISSTWVIHDVKNRYRLLPKIAKAINPHCVRNYEKYTAKNATLDDCSQQLIRDELWEILSTIKYLASIQSIPTKNAETPEDIPVFVVMDRDQKIDVLNADLEKITPSGFFKFPLAYAWSMSTTKIGDNLFVLFSSYDFILFQVYNFRLKKRFKLSSDPRITKYSVKFTLLNCNNEIYCCWKNGSLIAKYSMQLDCWIIMSQQSQHEKSKKPRFQFASDGKMLYRTCEVSKNGGRPDYIIETYDFEKNLWTCEPDFPAIRDVLGDPLMLTVINDRDLAVSFHAEIVIFDRDSKTWRHCGIPKELRKSEHLFHQHKDRLLFVVNNKLYHVSLSNDNWEYKKDYESYSKWGIRFNAAIHRMN